MNEVSANVQDQQKNVKKGSPVAPFVLGAMVGFIICGVLVFQLMPGMMIITKECNQNVEETVKALETSIEKNGWVVSGVSDMNHSMAKHGVEFGPAVRLVKLCKPEYASSILTSDRQVSCMMPCTMAVWEGDDGKTYLSKMNLGLMAKMFGGNIAEIMGGKVVEDESLMLEGIVKKH